MVYYVSSTKSTLTCVEQLRQVGLDDWYGCGGGSTWVVIRAPNAYVARHSHHLSATTSGENILLSYEDFSNVLNVMYGVRQAETFEWHNITSDALSAASPDDDYQLAEMCSVLPFRLYCFIINKQRLLLGIMAFRVFNNTSNVSDIEIKCGSRRR